MTRREPSTRNGAEGTGKGSWRSQDTVRGELGPSSRGKQAQLRTGKPDLFEKELPTTPPYGGLARSTTRFLPTSPDNSPKDNRMASAARGYRRDLSILDNSAGRVPLISNDPPSASTPIANIAPWATEETSGSPYSEFPSESAIGDFKDDVRYPTALRPGTGGTAMTESPDGLSFDDERRPSVASTTTVSSHGSDSKMSAGRKKKLAGFFGEDPSSQESRRQNSDSSIPMMGQRTLSSHSHRDRNNSIQANNDSQITPAASRPRTPVPSSDVVPWLFQNFQDIPQYGDAPVRQALAGLDKQRYAEKEKEQHPTSNPNHHHHRFHFPGHRHTRSKEETSKPSTKDSGHGFPPRPAAHREDSAANLQRLKDQISSPMTSHTSLGLRTESPTPSANSSLMSRDTPPSQRSPADGSSGKRSIFGKLRRNKGDRGLTDTLKELPVSTPSLQDPSTQYPSGSVTEISPRKRSRDGSVATFDSGATMRASDRACSETVSQKKDGGGKLLHGHGKFSRPSRRGFSYESPGSKESDNVGENSTGNSSIWNLDTDLSHMEGIISSPPADITPHGGIYLGGRPSEDKGKVSKALNEHSGPGAWDAPDSWAVAKVGDENMARLQEIDEASVPQKDEDDGISHCVRVFRIDSTFATLSTHANTTVSEILQMLGKKSFLQDDLGNYQIIMRKHDLQRQLALSERPIAIQKRLLEQAGYLTSDHLEEIGREDNSYLCRFTFVPTKLSGYYSLEKDPGLGKMQKFSHVDLQGRSLVTIPITLYSRANEIISLNLSRNLSLDVPKDFIQSCNNLKEIKYTSNEAWRLPPSLSLASKLQRLDISNNRLEQLEHADLEKLSNLISIKMSNNKITRLPPYFGRYTVLRSLNLSSNYLEAFPDYLCDLKSLVDLDISFNSITALPSIGQLTTLERLWATNNNLSGSFDDGFDGLVNLKEIDIRFNAITNIDVVSRLPRLEQLMVGHNAISVFEGAFSKIRILHIDHNPLTRFDVTASVPSLTSLNVASAKLAQLDDDLFEKMPSLAKLNMDKNLFTAISPQIGKLRRLEYLSVAKNPLSLLPPTIGCLQELRYLDVRECNLKKLPVELWCCFRLDTLNVSSNVLESFPKPGPALQAPQLETPANGSKGSAAYPPLSSSPSYEELGKLENFSQQRPSQVPGSMMTAGGSPASATRKGSAASMYGAAGRRPSVLSRTPTDGTMSTISRKDSNVAQRLTVTFAGSLRQLYMADNRLEDDVFDEITLLPELRVLNLSWNELTEIPPRSLRRWPHLAELYLSGNDLASLPSDDLEVVSSLKVLHINGNKFQVLPAELKKVDKLAILDVGSNLLKYNVSNWPYDWNWTWNTNLKYLNFSGNKRLEIKPHSLFSNNGNREGADLTSFSTLQNMKVLGLMDVTLTISSIPDETEDRRVRTSGSVAGTMAYGMADSLGRNEHLSTIDMVVPKFRGHDSEIVLGMFDGQAMSNSGSKIAKFLHENFNYHFVEELSRLKAKIETPADALRRTFLALNKELATAASQSMDEREQRGSTLSHRGSAAAQTLGEDDLKSGGVATVMYLDNMELYVANVGDAQAMLMHSDGGFRILTRKHDPADPQERERIRDAGGYVSRHGKLNDVLDVSRAFGYTQMMPAVMAAPSVTQVTLNEQDEMILIASRDLWEYLTPDVVVDVARSERGDLMRAAQKLRDFAMAFGSSGKIMVMMIGVSELKKRERNRYRGQSLSMGPSQLQDDQILSTKRGKRPRDGPDDSTLGRLDQEIEAPTGEVSIVFTDIKNSTLLWETYPVAMRAAIKEHNLVMRRQLRILGGYEVKTEGDAFMVSFPTATSALLWCFSSQSRLLEANWPSEILSSIHGQELHDADGNLIFRGLSVRMGIHWGTPVCETDPVTRRMDYFGPMVNRAARISAVADGGQITVSSEFIAEIHRIMETYTESDRSYSSGSEDTLGDDIMAQAIRSELRKLSGQGFEVKDLGERKLKGLENPEYIYTMFPHALAGRLIVQQQRMEAEAAAASDDPGTLTRDSQLTTNIEIKNVLDLWNVSLRLEMLCSVLECPGAKCLKPPETAMLERMRNRGGEVTDRFLVSFVEHLVAGIETCITTLAFRHMVRPFDSGKNLLEQACPMADIFRSISQQLAELKAFKERDASSFGAA